MDEERSTKKNKVSGDGTVDRNEASNVKHDANDSDIVGKDSEGEDFITDDRDLMLQSWICTRSSMGHSSKGTIGSSNSAGREWYHCCTYKEKGGNHIHSNNNNSIHDVIPKMLPRNDYSISNH